MAAPEEEEVFEDCHSSEDELYEDCPPAATDPSPKQPKTAGGDSETKGARVMSGQCDAAREGEPAAAGGGRVPAGDGDRLAPAPEAAPEAAPAAGAGRDLSVSELAAVSAEPAETAAHVPAEPPPTLPPPASRPETCDAPSPLRGDPSPILDSDSSEGEAAADPVPASAAAAAAEAEAEAEASAEAAAEVAASAAAEAEAEAAEGVDLSEALLDAERRPHSSGSSEDGDSAASGPRRTMAPSGLEALREAQDETVPRRRDSAAAAAAADGAEGSDGSGGAAAAAAKESDDDGELVTDPDAVDEEALRRLDEAEDESAREQRRLRAAELKAEGNRLYAGSSFDAARERYTAALRVCPLTAGRERAVLFSNRAACRARADDEAGAVADCGCALELDPEYVRPLQRRAELHERAERLDEALDDWRRLLELQPGSAEARRAVARLPPLIEQRNERLKTEMLGKLKELGNMIMRPFGLSTDNFQLEQNEGGGYSVKFRQS